MDSKSPIPSLQQCRDSIEKLSCVTVARMFRVPDDPPGPDILPDLDRLATETTPSTRTLLKAGIEAARSSTNIIDTIPTEKVTQLTDIAEKYYIIGRTWDRLHAEINQALSMLALSRAMADCDPARIAEAWQAMMGHEAITHTWHAPMDLSQLITTPPSGTQWFARERLQLGRGALLTGIGGSSKTRIIYHLGTGAIIGRVPWDWDIECTGKAMLVLTEDTSDDVHRTLHSVCNGMGLSLDERTMVYSSLTIYPLAGQDLKLLSKTKNGTLNKTEQYHSLVRHARETGPYVLIAVDPALSVTDGDELDQSNQRALGKMIDDLAVATGACCILVAHASKGSNHLQELGSHNARGGGAITDAVRAEYTLRTMTAQEATKASIVDLEERKRHVQLVATKGNSLPTSAYVPIWLRRDNYGSLSQAHITLDGSSPTNGDMEALELLKDMSLTSTPPLKEWRSACQEEGIFSGTDDAIKKNMQRTINRLLKSGLIRKGHGRGIYVPNEF